VSHRGMRFATKLGIRSDHSSLPVPAVVRHREVFFIPKGFEKLAGG
jgi:hypothetical protein